MKVGLVLPPFSGSFKVMKLQPCCPYVGEFRDDEFRGRRNKRAANVRSRSERKYIGLRFDIWVGFKGIQLMSIGIYEVWLIVQAMFEWYVGAVY